MVKPACASEQQDPVHMGLTPITVRTRRKQGRPNSSTSPQRREVENKQPQRPATVVPSRDGVASGRGRKAIFHLACYRCRCLMEFDPGSRFVQCYKCFAINAVLPTKGGRGRHDGVEVLGVICPCCLTTNLVSCRARLVRCNICSTVSAAPAYARASFSFCASSSSPPSSSPSSSACPFPHKLFFSQSSSPRRAAKEDRSICDSYVHSETPS